MTNEKQITINNLIQGLEALRSEAFTRESLITLQEEEIDKLKQECKLAEQLITGILKTLNLEVYDWRTDQNEILTEVRTLEEQLSVYKNLVTYITRPHCGRELCLVVNGEEADANLLIKYHKALEEIEEYCNLEIAVTGDLPFRTITSDILDIISKTKGEE